MHLQHCCIEGYLFDADHVVSEDGLGKNNYIKDDKTFDSCHGTQPGLR
ncbi:MAG: DUF1846 family protein [Eggerthellaceae bacterium]|nr:DUF1846 family protein [Eggerthellaceae bacterium]